MAADQFKDWQNMDLMSDIIEPTSMDSNVMFPMCSPKTSNSFQPAVPSVNNIVNYSSPDFNKNKSVSNKKSHITPPQAVKLSKQDRIFYNRMDLSSPTEPGSYLYDTMQTSGSGSGADDMSVSLGRSLSSESSSSGLEQDR